MRILGVVLVIAGIATLVWGRISYTKRRDTMHVGPFSATVAQKETVAIPPVVPGIALGAGIVLVLFGGRRRS